ncbi:hypothetical protein ACS0TY_015532 [Phlomoides rotata]
MAEITKIEAKVETKCAPDKLYNFFKCNLSQCPDIFPQVFKSVQIIEGEAGQVGNVMLCEYVLGNTMTAKLRAEKINDGERSVTIRVIEGDILQLYSSFATKITVNDGFVHWSIEFEKKNESAPAPDAYVKLAVKVTKGIDLYLLNH